MNSKDYTECEVISIEAIGGVKFIHYMGYGYYAGSDDTPTPYRFLEYTFLLTPLEEALNYVSSSKGIMAWESDNQEFVTQYIEDCTYERMNEIYMTYDNGNMPAEIKEEEVNLSTPCGFYILV